MISYLMLKGIKYLTLIDACSGYDNPKLDNKLSYLATFSCPFSRYRYIQLPYGEAPAGDMSQKKTDELFSSIPNIFSTADNILIAGFDKQCKGHNETSDKVLPQTYILTRPLSCWYFISETSVPAWK